jgi:hypothetical protein
MTFPKLWRLPSRSFCTRAVGSLLIQPAFVFSGTLEANLRCALAALLPVYFRHHAGRPCCEAVHADNALPS